MRDLKKFFLIFIFVFFTSCRWFLDATSPFIMGGGFKVPPGTPAFQQGYRHGCSQIFYSRGNYFYRWRYKYEYDPKMNGNPEYRFGYARGRAYCFQYIINPASAATGSSDMYLFPHKEDSGFIGGGFGAMDYNTTVSGMFGGLGTPINVNPGNGFDAIFDVLQKGGSGSGKTAFGADPFWAGGSSGQFFGQ